MTKKKYKVIWLHSFNVDAKEVNPGEIIEVESSTREVKTLVRHGYLEEVK